MRRKRYELRLISAREAMEASREAAGKDALYRNACVLWRALYCGGRQVFSSAEAVLEAMPAQTVACWMGAYNALCQSQVAHWQEEKDALKRDGWGRLKWKVMRAMGGLNFRDMADGEFLYCLLQMILDGEEQLEKLCPSCRGKLGQEGCPVCGTVTFGENPNFDESRFEELKKHGSFEVDMESAGDGV